MALPRKAVPFSHPQVTSSLYLHHHQHAVFIAQNIMISPRVLPAFSNNSEMINRWLIINIRSCLLERIAYSIPLLPSLPTINICFWPLISCVSIPWTSPRGFRFASSIDRPDRLLFPPGQRSRNTPTLPPLNNRFDRACHPYLWLFFRSSWTPIVSFWWPWMGS